MDEITTQHLLYDLYGSLLTERQRQVLEDRLFEDHSLQEIAEHLGISRQGVHDLFSRSMFQLEDYEKKLGFVQEYIKRRTLLLKLQKRLSEKHAMDEEIERVIRELIDGEVEPNV
ncbi:YlxM family DNA-binding protein [Ferroacidibacillus organovorans]|uniref:UPF0122 protein ATW55_07010 n=1 Tax=Ferroacidibacillus organovorans TaxID=1765683 RepID=A0A124IVX6_9BACL|nr:sigma factor-like helix-turn-helix DNA-binding protein [Ferroacidibacillus organovorans]KUO95614.1 hypothetical protein ATW55_07010 [Ferroacidibacillus organovorans]